MTAKFSPALTRLIESALADSEHTLSDWRSLEVIRDIAIDAVLNAMCAGTVTEDLTREFCAAGVDGRRKAVLALVAKARRAAGIDDRVLAVRADRKVGRGSCSAIDECFTDAELAAFLDEEGVRSIGGALRVSRAFEARRRAYADDIRFA